MLRNGQNWIYLKWITVINMWPVTQTALTVIGRIALFTSRWRHLSKVSDWGLSDTTPISRLVTDSSWHTDIPAPFFPPHYPLPGFTSFRHREPGVHVWDPGESVCGDGEAPWRHAGDDPLQWKGETSWEAHQVSDHTGDLLIVCRL